MVIWRITGDEIGPDACGAAFFETRAEAEKALREYRQACREKITTREDYNGKLDKDYPYTSGPEKVTVRNRNDLVHELSLAMGYGSS